jgi:DNA-binding NtrC family response regulator
VEIGKTADPIGAAASRKSTQGGGEEAGFLIAQPVAAEDAQPYPSPSAVLSLSAQELCAEVAPARDRILAAWIAADPASLRLLEEAQRAAGGADTILIRGESGTGKRLLATLLHYLGASAAEPLVRVDCASLTPEILEAELFGCERDVVPELPQGKAGALEIAAAGTVVLEEIAALRMPAQARLLRVIEEKHFVRLADSRSLPLRCRILALTSVDLEHAIARRSFREDLYYRLGVVSLALPPLRRRRLDIPPLAAHFLAQLTEMHRKRPLSVAPAAMALLESYAFPGNVRELRHLMEQAVLRCASPEILPQDLQYYVRESNAAAPQKNLSLEELERAHIAEVLEHTRGKKTEAAQILGISRKTLLEKRKRYGLQ